METPHHQSAAVPSAAFWRLLHEEVRDIAEVMQLCPHPEHLDIHLLRKFGGLAIGQSDDHMLTSALASVLREAATTSTWSHAELSDTAISLLPAQVGVVVVTGGAASPLAGGMSNSTAVASDSVSRPEQVVQMLQSVKDVSDLVETFHNGRLSQQAGASFLRSAILPEGRRASDVEPTDVLDHLGSAGWETPVASLRGAAAAATLQVLSTVKHLEELSTFEDSARVTWVGVLGLLEAVQVMRSRVGDQADGEYTVAGVPACPLLHTTEATTYICVVRGLLPKPECSGVFHKYYQPYTKTWCPPPERSGPVPPPITVPTTHPTKLTSLQGLLAQLATSAVQRSIDALNASLMARQYPEASLHFTVLLRSLWVLLHVGGAYYLSPAEAVAVYGTANCCGVHSGSWLTSELEAINLNEKHGFCRSRVTYTDMVIASVFKPQQRHRHAFKDGEVNWYQLGTWMEKHKADNPNRGSLVADLSRSNACLDAMVGSECLYVMDSDGTAEHIEQLQFITCGIWDSKVFNPGSQPPPPETEPGTTWGANPFKRPGVKRVLIDVLYTRDFDDKTKIRHVNFKPNSNQRGDGSPKAIIVLYAIQRPGLPPRLVLASHKASGKGSGSSGHFIMGWHMFHGQCLAPLVAELAEKLLGVPGWGARMKVPFTAHSPVVLSHASLAFPKSLLRPGWACDFEPYTMQEVLCMDSVAKPVSNSVLEPRSTLLDPPPAPRVNGVHTQSTPMSVTPHEHHTRGEGRRAKLQVAGVTRSARRRLGLSAEFTES